MARHSFFDHLKDNPTFLVKESLQLIAFVTIYNMIRDCAKGNDLEFSNTLYQAGQLALVASLIFQTGGALVKTILDCPLSNENKSQQTLGM